jgi:HPt (histidine-containing phosphotransfer) domain-containing protein
MFLHKFAARASDQVAALKRALDSGNAAELARQARAIKHVAAHLPTDALHQRADELERTAERGDLESAGAAVERTREEIARSAEAAIELLSQLLAE